jgi:hypothetical protein
MTEAKKKQKESLISPYIPDLNTPRLYMQRNGNKRLTLNRQVPALHHFRISTQGLLWLPIKRARAARLGNHPLANQ